MCRSGNRDGTFNFIETAPEVSKNININNGESTIIHGCLYYLKRRKSK